MSEIWTPGQELVIPDFNSYIRRNRQYNMRTGMPSGNYGDLDATRLAVAGLISGESVASTSICINPETEKKVKIDGENHCILRYEKNGIHRPVNVMGFDEYEGEVILNQIQWVKDRVSTKVHALMDLWGFYGDFLEENFFKNGIPVVLKKHWQDHITAADIENDAYMLYDVMDKRLELLKRKYNLY